MLLAAIPPTYQVTCGLVKVKVSLGSPNKMVMGAAEDKSDGVRKGDLDAPPDVHVLSVLRVVA